MVFTIGFAILLSIGLTNAEDVILKPLNQSGPEVALILIQGADIKPEQYVPLAQSVQNVSEYALWVGIVECPLDLPAPLEVSVGVNRILSTMRSSGMTATSVFFAGHSLGGAALQDYLYSDVKSAPGQILLGSFLLRKYRNESYPVPTITIGGELDGLARVTRIMEEYYHRVLHSTEEQKIASATFPVVVVEGLSHMQFASGDPPALVKDRDLQPEISYEEAHAIVGSLVASFIAVRLGDASQQHVIDDALSSTGVFVQPLIAAYEQEGFYNFVPPCYNTPPNPSCTIGCPWTERAQQIMGGLYEATVVVTDAFHPVDQINPIHLPHIWNNCSGGDVPSCTLNVTTVSQAIYDELDSLDTGFYPNSASEIRAKLKARQAVMEASGMSNVDFNVSDGSSLCSLINEASFDWAYLQTASKTWARFEKFGERLIMGTDKGPYNAGPLWIWNPLHYEKSTDASDRAIVLVQSPMMRTPTDYFLPVAAGFHYCKLLSPGRAIEWIYVDGLREYYSLNNSTSIGY